MTSILFHLLFAVLLLSAAVCDLKSQIIPPLIVLLCLIVAPGYPQFNWISGLIGGCLTGAILLAATLWVPGAFGGGDIKLVAACSFALGFPRSLAALVIAITLSLIPCIYYKISKQKTHIAFAPYIAAGFVLAAIFI